MAFKLPKPSLFPFKKGDTVVTVDVSQRMPDGSACYFNVGKVVTVSDGDVVVKTINPESVLIVPIETAGHVLYKLTGGLEFAERVYEDLIESSKYLCSALDETYPGFSQTQDPFVDVRSFGDEHEEPGAIQEEPEAINEDSEIVPGDNVEIIFKRTGKRIDQNVTNSMNRRRMCGIVLKNRRGKCTVKTALLSGGTNVWTCPISRVLKVSKSHIQTKWPVKACDALIPTI